MFWATLIVTTVALTSAHENSTVRGTRRSYVCPPEFVRTGNKCYYFSTASVTFEDAYWKCNDRRSSLAIIKNANQDKILRSILKRSKNQLYERWIGARYDWEQMTWQWAHSGKTLTYQGFTTPQSTDAESMRWHCITLDPKIQYRWDHKSCLEKKHYICQTRLKNVSRKNKKKLERQYNASKYKKLNEVPVPQIGEIADNRLHINRTSTDKSIYNYDNNLLSNSAYANRPRPLRKRKGRKGKGRKKNKIIKDQIHYNGTLQDAPQKDHNVPIIPIDRVGHKPAGKLRWKTYYKATISPLLPRGIVEEFSFT